MALEIDWREPPPSLEERLKQALKNQPGRWARIKKDMKSPTSKAAWRKEGFDADSYPAESDPKLYDIYARWPSLADTAIAHAEAGIISKKDARTAAEKAGVTPRSGKAPAPKPQPAPNTEAHEPELATSGDATGGYLASRSRRAVPTAGATNIPLAGHHPSPVRP